MDLSHLSVKRQLKRAKLFEIRKIIRQIRMLENKKGTEAQLQKSKRKVERLAEILDALKDLDLGSLAQELGQNLQEGCGLPSSRDSGEQTSSGSCTERAKHRLITNKTFQRNINRLCESSKLRPRTQQQSDTSPEEEVEPENGSKRENDSREESDSSSDKSTSLLDDEAVVEQEREMISDASGDENETTSEEGSSSECDDGDVQSRVVHKPSGTKRRLSVRERQRGERERRKVKQQSPPTSDGGGGGTRRKGLPLESTFMGALSENSYSPAASLKSSKSLKSNRPGQRTRQKKWEKMYGVRAKHLAAVARKKQQKRKNMTGKVKVVKGSRVTTKQKALSVSRQKAKNVSSSSSCGDTQLHPSWEAQRRKKALETGIHQFQGQKIVFSD